MNGAFPGYFPRLSPEGGNPWQAGANAYGQELDRLQALQFQGMQQQAQGPASLYDRFMQGYLQKKQEEQQAQQFSTDQAYKQAQITHLGYQNEDMLAKRKAAQEAADADIAFNNVLKLPGVIRPDGSADPARFNREMVNAGFGQYAPEYLSKFLKAQTDQAKIIKERAESGKISTEELGKIAATGKASGKNPAETLKDIEDAIAGNPELHAGKALPQGWQMMNPEAQNLLVLGLAGRAMPVDKLMPDATIQTIGGKTSAFAPNRLTGMLTKVQDLGVTAADAGGKIKQDVGLGILTPQEGDARMRKIDDIPVTNVQVQQAAAKDPQAEALREVLADQWFKEGRPPAALSRNQPLLVEVGKRMAEKYPDADLAKMGADFAANRASLTGLTKNLDAVEAFSNTAKRSYDAFEKAVAELGNTTSPWLNTPINKLAAGAAGDERVTKAAGYGRTAMTEFARVITQPNLTGQLTDNARHEMFSILGNTRPEDATLGQVKALGTVLRNESSWRKDSIVAQRAEAMRRISGGSEAAAPSSDTVRVKSKDGRTGTVPRSQLAKAKLEGYTEI